MPKHGKKYLETKKIDREHYYEPLEAFQLLKEIAGASFDETVELSVKLGLTKACRPAGKGAVVLPTALEKSSK